MENKQSQSGDSHDRRGTRDSIITRQNPYIHTHTTPANARTQAYHHLHNNNNVAMPMSMNTSIANTNVMSHSNDSLHSYSNARDSATTLNTLYSYYYNYPDADPGFRKPKWYEYI